MKTSLLLLSLSTLALIGCKPTAAPVEPVAVAAPADCSELEAKLAATQLKYASLDAARQRQAALRAELESKLAALVEAGTLRIHIRRGLLVIDLDNKVLFDSGKATVKEEGRTTLTTVGAALASIDDRRFLVAGHTDNVKVSVKSPKFKSNWELASLRSLAALNVLLAAEVPPTSLGLAGFGEFDPVGDNETEEGRAQNRRTEIIVLPDFSAIMAN